MPIPSLTQRMYDEGLQQGREEFVASMSRQRFGPEARVHPIAHRLAALDPDDCLTRISAAADLDELAEANS
jgi:hypothetical protein